MTDYSTFDIEKLLGIPRLRVQDWVNRGFVTPSSPAPGQGRKATFTRKDLYGIMFFQKLLDSGFKRLAASRFVGFIHTSENEDGFFMHITFIDGTTQGSWIFSSELGKVSDHEFSRQIFNLGAIKRFVDKQLG